MQDGPINQSKGKSHVGGKWESKKIGTQICSSLMGERKQKMQRIGWRQAQFGNRQSLVIMPTERNAAPSYEYKSASKCNFRE